jgi:hypothetical protein
MFTFFGAKKPDSKMKGFTKFYLHIDHLGDHGGDFSEIFRKFYNAFKKAVTTNPKGEAAFKMGLDGGYTNPFDAFPETLKFFEDTINASGLNEGDKKTVRIGF